MKLGLKIVVALILATLTMSCGEDKERNDDPKNYDGWMLTSWNGSTTIAGKVYLQLKEDFSFNLYQSIQTTGYRKFTGTYSIDGADLLSGSYIDGTPWESSYKIEKQTMTELQLRSRKDNTVSIYAGVEIPAYVKDGVTDKDVRAATIEKPFL